MIIGLIGKLGSGKTVVADHLVWEYQYTKLNMKDSLIKEMKEKLPDVLDKMLQMDYEVSVNNLTGNFKMRKKNFKMDLDRLFREKPPVMRALMQNYGTEIRRHDDPDYWVKKWCEALENTEGDIVVDDVRFQNEADMIRLLGGKIVRITRSDVTDTGNHQSEKEMESIEFDLEMKCNEGEQDKLYRMVDLFIEEHGKG